MKSICLIALHRDGETLEGYKIASDAVADLESAKLHILFEIGTSAGNLVAGSQYSRIKVSNLELWKARCRQ